VKLHELSVRKPVLVMIGLVSLLSLGGIASVKLPVEFLPHVEFPFIGVFIPYPNSHPDYIERHIVKPVEEVFATLGDVRNIESQTQSDGAFVGVEFQWGRDVGVLRMEVKEKLDQIKADLPSDIEHMQVFTFDTNDIPILEGRISAVGRDLAGSYDLIERSIINPLKRLEGVGNVFINGVEPKEIAIYLMLDKIKAHHVDVENVFRLLQSANASASGGEVTADGIRYSIRSIGSFSHIEDVENLVVSPEGLRLATTAATFSESNILRSSLRTREQPEKRVSQVWTYFGQRDPTKSLEDVDNYKSSALTIDPQAEADYGSAAIRKIFSRWIGEGGRDVA
jgi:HAE1 family hydrophobic/amphiphilic exporter-1